MAVTAKSQFEVRRIRPGSTRRRVLFAALVLVLVAAAGLLAGYLLAGSKSKPSPSNNVLMPVAASDDSMQALQQQIATLKRSEQVARIAAGQLRQTLADREQEVSALRADLAFYSRLVGSGEQRQGIAVHSIFLEPIAGSQAWNATITLTQNARRGEENHGTVKLAVEGVRSGKLVLLKWSDLVGSGNGKGIEYAFKYFQQLHTTLMLPDKFAPNRLRIEVAPRDGKSVTRSIPWETALKSPEEGNVQ